MSAASDPIYISDEEDNPSYALDGAEGDVSSVQAVLTSSSSADRQLRADERPNVIHIADDDEPANTGSATAESDHVLAMRLQAEFNAAHRDTVLTSLSSSSADEAYARSLVAEEPKEQQAGSHHTHSDSSFFELLTQLADEKSTQGSGSGATSSMVGKKRQRTEDSNSSSSNNLVAYHKAATDGDDTAFFLNHINGLHPRYTLRLGDIVEHTAEHPIQHLVLINYMFEIEYLDEQIPNLRQIPRVTVIHGQDPHGASMSELIEYARSKVSKQSQWSVNATKMPDAYGVMHTKMAICFYKHAVRVMICTANFIAVDWEYKQQAIYVQDFPKVSNTTPSQAHGTFEADLCSYMHCYRRHKVDPAIINGIVNELKQHDYTYARAQLIPSAPGFHEVTYRNGQSQCGYGHMKARTLLQQTVLPPQYGNTPVVAQISSMGSLTVNYLEDELARSLRASADAAQQAKPVNAFTAMSRASAAISRTSQSAPLRIIWPTVEDVRTGVEGWSAGGSLCFDSKNNKTFLLDSYFYKWDTSLSGRFASLPHIKTYCRPSNDGLGLAWAITGSTNISKSAWGQLVKNDTLLKVSHYEMSCLWTAQHLQQLLVHALQSAKDQQAPAQQALLQCNLFYSATNNKRLHPSTDELSGCGSMSCSEVLKRGIIVELTQPQPIDFFGVLEKVAATPNGDGIASSDEAGVKWQNLEASSSRTSNSASEQAPIRYRVVCPLPYNPKASKYANGDEPWCWDYEHAELDVHGYSWPGIRNR